MLPAIARSAAPFSSGCRTHTYASFSLLLRSLRSKLAKPDFSLVARSARGLAFSFHTGTPNRRLIFDVPAIRSTLKRLPETVLQSLFELIHGERMFLRSHMFQRIRCGQRADLCGFFHR